MKTLLSLFVLAAVALVPSFATAQGGPPPTYDIYKYSRDVEIDETYRQIDTDPATGVDYTYESALNAMMAKVAAEKDALIATETAKTGFNSINHWYSSSFMVTPGFEDLSWSNGYTWNYRFRVKWRITFKHACDPISGPWESCDSYVETIGN